MERTGAQCVVEELERNGCDVIFGYPGGAVLDIFDSIYSSPMHLVLPRHEQGAVHMADGYARATGRPGVCLVTSGPGATNTITGLATAYIDGTPMVCITGQVPLPAIGNDAFQEADTIGISRPCTKHNRLIRSVDEIPEAIAEAFYIASTGKPGPVLIDIPKDVQKQFTTMQTPEKVQIRSYTPHFEINNKEVAALAKAINKAKRPLLYVGGGAITAKACKALSELAHKAQIPVTTTLMGLGAFPETDPLSLNMLGMHGHATANIAVSYCDLLISVGARFSDRVTGKASEFAQKAQIAHIDIDPSSIGKSVRVDYPILGDAREALEHLLPLVSENKHEKWLEQLSELKAKYPLKYTVADGDIATQYVLEEVDRICQGNAIVVTDVGQHQMWAAQYITLKEPRTFITSGGLGTMGFGLPAAIGAQLGQPDRLVVAICGDGGIQMNAQELVVAVEHKLPVKTIILNNTYLGMVRQWQEMFYERRYSGVVLSQADRPKNERIEESKPVFLPDFVKLADAHGMNAIRITKPEDVRPTLERVFADRKPWLIEVMVETETNVFPMVPPGMSVAEMIID
ncbi:MAG: biosynthetic-type acetolactate synthase large subunit [Lentisphaerae bacterium]|nr:biosynthetic-type acetolactate synthase large subunit [Lentisphaerota bacterium]